MYNSKRKDRFRFMMFIAYGPFLYAKTAVHSRLALVNQERKVGIMKRVKAACITQTLHFQLKEDLGREYGIQMVKEEVDRYKKHMDRNGTQYRILSEKTLEDGSVLIEIKKQYNTSPVGTYLD